MKYTNDTLNYYAKPLSKSEKDNCESTIRVVKNILEDFGFETTRSTSYSNEDDLDYSYTMVKDNHEYTILLQGSYGKRVYGMENITISNALITALLVALFQF